MKLRKWNYETKQYDPYEVPEDWVLGFISNDMDLPINCAQCGKDMKFGDGYTSKELHTHVGLGYSVCEDCYEEEDARDEANRRRET